MDLYSKLVELLPLEDVLFQDISNTINSDIIFKQIHKVILNRSQTCVDKSTWNRSLELLDVLLDFLHDSLHVGEWHEVDIKIRKSYSIASFFKVLVILQLNETNNEESLDECAYLLDMSIMLGDKLLKVQENADPIEVLPETAKIVSSFLENRKASTSHPKKKLCIEELKLKDTKCDIPVIVKPSIETFLSNYYKNQKPILIKNSMDHWPALEKWKDMDYLISKAGSRTVPVELGSQYSSENWSQNLIKFEDFVRNYVLKNIKDSEDVAYLAQHDLFDQIPELKNDICQPEYILDKSPRIKAWFGPKGTVSPLHTDPTHNLLCQILGSKKIILASPEDTEKLYPHEHFMLNNTSQIDAENLDYNKFPLCKKVKFYSIILQHGDILYIPPKWWHHVRSLSPSFSISYWFE